MSDHIELNRTFQPIRRDENFNSVDWYRLFEPDRGETDWKALFEQARVIILAEAGMGKTHELREASRHLESEGHAAFFCRIEDLGAQEIVDAFEIGKNSFDCWLKSDEIGWFFLDSVDEARLSNRRYFDRGLRKLSRKLGLSTNRARIFISSRASDWRPTNDLQTVRKHFPPTCRSDSVDEKKETAKAQPVSAARAKRAAPHEIQIVQLTPLNEDQIRLFSGKLGVKDTSAFSDEITRSDLLAFAERPQDLIALANYWKEHKCFGRYSEMLAFNIDTKLKESNPDRDATSQLSVERIRQGATRLAAAFTFMRVNAVVVEGAGIESKDAARCIRLDKILDDWTTAERQDLLTRAIFDEATYGRVRFHHRDVREFLAAEWLAGLLRKGQSRRAVEGLILANRYEQIVVPPSMRPIAAWLALCDHGIQKKLLEFAPDILMAHGDPSALDIETRKRILTAYARLNMDRNDTGLSVDRAAVARLADPKLGSTVRKLFKQYGGNEGIRELLLRIVWQGKLTDCADQALTFALDREMDKYSRQIAVLAVSVSGSFDQRRIIAVALLREPSTWPSRGVGVVVGSMFPTVLSVSELLSVLEAIDPPEDGTLNYELENIVTDRCCNEDCADLLSGIVKLLGRPPFADGQHYKVSAKYHWLLAYAAKLAERVLLAHIAQGMIPNEDCLQVIEITAESARYSSLGSLRVKHKLGEIIPKNPVLRMLFFWRTAEQERTKRASKGKQLDHCWSVLIRVPYMDTLNADDFESFLGYAKSRELLDDKMIALSAAFKIWRSSGGGRSGRNKLHRAAKGVPELEAWLHERLHPGPLSPEERKIRDFNRKSKRQRKRATRESEANREKWIKRLRENPQRLREITQQTINGLFRDMYCLYHEMIRLADANNRFGCGEWGLLKPEFGNEVSEAFRDGLKAYWRLYTPRTTTAWDNKSTYGVSVGLSGLAIESSGNSSWAGGLSETEATIAITYAVHEMNGLPDWVGDLIEAHPYACEFVIKGELEWEATYEGENAPHYLLSSLNREAEKTKNRYIPYIFTLLKRKDPKHDQTLEHMLEFLLRSDKLDTQELASLAMQRFGGSSVEGRKFTWLVAWICVDADTALPALQAWVRAARDDSEAVRIVKIFCNVLIPHRSFRFQSKYRDFDRIKILRELVPFIYKHIRVEEDRQHEGGYSRDDRDDAETTRYYLSELVSKTPGRESFNTLIYFSKCLPHARSRDWMITLAEERAALDAESSPWTAADVMSFACTAEKIPQNQRELFELIVTRLDDIKMDLEDGDMSEARILVGVDAETVLRNWFAKRLGDTSRNRYSIAQEDELADATRPDIRIHAPSIDSPIPVELKIADKWTGPVLFQKLEVQLVGQYQRNVPTNFGIYLLARRGKKNYWELPNSKRRVDFDNLLIQLQVKADRISHERSDIEDIRVVGIDLTKR